MQLAKMTKSGAKYLTKEKKLWLYILHYLYVTKILRIHTNTLNKASFPHDIDIIPSQSKYLNKVF